MTERTVPLIGSPVRSGAPHSRRWRHPAWVVAAVAFVALVGAAGFRAAPGVLIVPLEHEFGWPRWLLSAAVAVNLVLFGLTAPFAAALMDRFGIRRVTATALVLVAVGSGATVAMTASWQLVLCWGVLVGVGTGSMALVFAATVAQRWFVAHRGLVTGVLTAGSATGQLVFLPVTAWVAGTAGWRTASLVIAAAALAVVPLVLLFLRDRPADVGVQPYGAPADVPPPPEPPEPSAARPIGPAVGCRHRSASPSWNADPRGWRAGHGVPCRQRCRGDVRDAFDAQARGPSIRT